MNAGEIGLMMALAKSSGGGGGGGGGGGSLPFDVVNLKWDATEGEWTTDMTNAAISASLSAGKTVLALVQGKQPSQSFVAPMAQEDVDVGGGVIVHYVYTLGVTSGIDTDRGKASIYQARVDIDDEDYVDQFNTTIYTGDLP